MGDQDNSAEEYRKFHASEFAVWLSSDVARLFASKRFALLGAGGLMLLTAINCLQVFGLAFPPLRSISSPKMLRYTPFYVDVIFFGIILGVLYIVSLALGRNIAVVNAPIQIILLISCLFSYHSTSRRNVIRNLCFGLIAALLTYAIDRQYFWTSLIQFPSALIAGIFLNNQIFSSMELRFFVESTNQKEKAHAFEQLTKLVYPHQVERVQAGYAIEETMPIGRGSAYVLCFDIVDSSTIMHENFRTSKDSIFTECYDLMMGGYSRNPLSSRAFRIKEMGDGFLCSVGFPFRSSSAQSGADSALDLARRFQTLVSSRIRELNYHRPIHCSIGIAYGQVEGFFPSSGLKLYDLWGPAIVLASRYEQLRKVIYRNQEAVAYDIIAFSEAVYANLSQASRVDTRVWEVRSPDHRIRGDAGASRAFYITLSSGVEHDIQIGSAS